MNRTLGELARRLGGTLHGVSEETFAGGFATDNRKVKPGDLFLCIKGARVDGHVYAKGAIEAGACAVIAEREVPEPHIRVEALIPALAKMAGGFRKEFAGPVVGVTGSAGKTTAKELISAGMGSLGPILKSQGNQNTEFTSPLLWAELSDQKAAVIEMAMRGAGQIAHLAQFTKPTIGVVTNIGWSHLEMVGSRLGIARAKSELLEALPDEGMGVYWAEDDFLEHLIEVHPRYLSFGFSDGADVRITSYAVDGETMVLAGTASGANWETRIPLVGRHLALNVAAAIATCVAAGLDPQESAARMAGVELPPMRMEIKEIAGVKYLIDTYNAAPPSSIAALETLVDLAPGRRFAVLGQMNELGDESDHGHRLVGRRLGQLGYAGAIIVGDKAAPMLDAARDAGMVEVRMARNMQEVRDFLGKLKSGDAVVLKGSRSLELENALPEGAR